MASILDDDDLGALVLAGILYGPRCVCGSDHGEDCSQQGLWGRAALEKLAYLAHLLESACDIASFVRGGEILLGLDESSADACHEREKIHE